MRNFCTLFDRRYLRQGLLLYESLVRHCHDLACLWVLCLDQETYEWFRKHPLPKVKPVSLAALEAEDREFERSRQGRSKAEYFFTAKSVLMSRVFSAEPETESLTYLDSDIYFFREPAGIAKKLGGASIGITPHRFAGPNADRERFGLYNAGFVYFRNNEAGKACLAEWRANCIESCNDSGSGNQYADQGYLNEWPRLYGRGVQVLEEPGINSAPWNIEPAALSRGPDGPLIHGSPLICYHFHALKPLSPRIFQPSWENYSIRPNRQLIDFVYRPYLKHYRACSQRYGLPFQREEIERSHQPRWVRERTLRSTIKAVLMRQLIFA